MTINDFTLFYRECLVFDDDTEDGLDFESLYGLYISWCRLNHMPLDSEASLGRALKLLGFHSVRHNHHKSYIGLRMTGPAARDYILHTEGCWDEFRSFGSRHGAEARKSLLAN